MNTTLATLMVIRAHARAKALAADALIRPLLNGDVHTFSSTQVDLPPSLADALISIQTSIPEEHLTEDGYEQRPHITVKYGIHSDSPAETQSTLESAGPIRVTLGTIQAFEHDDQDVVYASVDSPQLVLLNAILSARLDVTDTFPTYTPHATIAYVQPGKGQLYTGNDVLKGMTALITEIRFISRDGMEYVIPLTNTRAAGGPGSGNFGHSGRPGEVGGSGGEGAGPHQGAYDRGFYHGQTGYGFQKQEAGRKGSARHDAYRKGYDAGVDASGEVKRTPAEPPPPAEKPVLSHTIKRGPDFQMDGTYHLKFSDGREYPIFRDTDSLKLWGVAGLNDSRMEAFTKKELIERLTHLDESQTYVDKYSGRRDKGTIRDALKDTRKNYGLAVLGGPGSGNFGHSGRPGEVGGSGGGDGGHSAGMADKINRMDVFDKFTVHGMTVRRDLYGTWVVYNDTVHKAFETGKQAHDYLESLKPSKQVNADPHSLDHPVDVYHNSPDQFAENKPTFGAYFGDANFLKAFPNEWGEHTYKVTLPKGSKVLDLNKDTPEARVFMETVAKQAYPKDTEYQARLRRGDPQARSHDEFYELWTDKRNILGAMKKHTGYDAVRYDAEYVLPPQTLKKLKGEKLRTAEVIRSLGGVGSGNFGHSGRPGEVGGSGEGEHALGPRPTPIKVSKVKDAIPLILQGKVVELPNVRKVNVLMQRLAKIAKDAVKKGEAAPQYDACQIVVPGSNIFCGEHLKTKEYPNGMPRIVMPQFAGEPRPGSQADKLPKDEKGVVDAGPEFIDHLAKRGIASKSVEVPSNSLLPSQAQLDGPKIAKRISKKDYAPSSPIFISRDNYIVDGHHRWAAIVGRDAEDGHLGDSKIRAIRIDAPISEILKEANKWTKKYGLERKAVEPAKALPKAAGGPGSGNFGHSGRPGEVGGSGGDGGPSQGQLFSDLKPPRGSVKDLKTGKVTGSDGLTGTINNVQVLTLDTEHGPTKAIFKPVSGESWTQGQISEKGYREEYGQLPSNEDQMQAAYDEGYDFSSEEPIRQTITNRDFTYAEREAAAYDVDEVLGLGVVPATTIRTVDNVEGSVQTFVDAATDRHWSNKGEVDQDSVYGMAILDIATGNTDRHYGNILIDEDGKLVAIDHGLTFPSAASNTDEGQSEFRPVASGEALYKHDGPMSDAYAARIKKGLDETDWNALAARKWPNMNSDEREAFLERMGRLKEAFDPDIYDSPSSGVRQVMYDLDTESSLHSMKPGVLHVNYPEAA